MRKNLISAIDATRRRTGTALRAVGYFRVSTEEQAKGYGITYTQKRVTKYVEKKGWGYVESYADEGYSGSLDHTQRPELKKLMEAAQLVPRPFDVVVVSEERAIGRRDRAFWPWVWKLEDLGIFVAIVKGDYDNTTEEGRSRMRKAQDAAEDERIVIRDRTQGGVQEKAEAGGWPGGPAPYGYQIENQGKRGESRAVLFMGDETAPYSLLHRARRLLVHENMTCGEVEALYESEGIPGPDGRNWPKGCLRHILLGQAIQESRRLFRNPNNPRVRVDADGDPIFGETVEILLDPVFSPEELQELNQALARTAQGPRPRENDEIHPLSGRVFGLCGAHFTGATQGRARRRRYRCTGNRQRDRRTEKCGCESLDAELIEGRVWSEVCDLLANPEKLVSLAQELLDMTKASGVDYTARIEDLGSQIEDLELALSITTATTARQAARRKLSPQAAKEFTERATRPLEKELAELESLRDEAVTWQQAADGQVARARDLQRLAEKAGSRMYAMALGQQEEVYRLLDLRVTVLGQRTRRRVRSDDVVIRWFRDRNAEVPLLTDAAWGHIAPIFEGRPGRKVKIGPRAYLEAVLTKARTGCPWSSVPGAQSIFYKWSTSGLWERLMEALEGFPGTPVAQDADLPPLRIEGRVDPRLLVGNDSVPAEEGLKTSSVRPT
ncbi:DNA invertase Pin-like site-specific DNA recombinase [Streptacidiphilus sp. MAP5-52]